MSSALLPMKAIVPWLAAAIARAVVVPTENGPVEGVRRLGGTSWWGLRHAEPPVGELRFKEPQGYKETWQSPRTAKQIPSPCPQLTGNSMRGQEDCLFLNVHRPSQNLTGLPVMVFFYGGGFSEGSSYEMGLYDGLHLSSRHDMLVVTLNYRLCALGFMATQHVSQFDDCPGPGFLATRGSQHWQPRATRSALGPALGAKASWTSRKLSLFT